jgi:hypothetical protein
MSSYNIEQRNPFSYMDYVQAHWSNESEPQSYSNNTVCSLNVVDYADGQSDADISSFLFMTPYSSPGYVPSVPLHTSFNAQPSTFPQPFPAVSIHPILRDPSSIQSSSHRQLSAEVTSPSLFVSASTMVPCRHQRPPLHQWY